MRSKGSPPLAIACSMSRIFAAGASPLLIIRIQAQADIKPCQLRAIAVPLNSFHPRPAASLLYMREHQAVWKLVLTSTSSYVIQIKVTSTPPKPPPLPPPPPTPPPNLPPAPKLHRRCSRSRSCPAPRSLRRPRAATDYSADSVRWPLTTAPRRTQSAGASARAVGNR